MKIPEMKVNIVSRTTIKPASPTPPHLRTHSLSLFDQHMSPIYVNFLFFYPSPINNGDGDTISNALKRSRLLQISLSETLVHFYPMAGQLKDDVSIDCNDEGAYFVEARIGCHLADFLSNPDSELLKCFFPTNDVKTTELAFNANAMLLVQISIFECGGMAIALSISHKIADATSDHTFIQSWAAMSHGNNGEVVIPEFIGSSLLPPKDLPHEPTPTAAAEKCTTRRFVFDGAKIASLKAKIGGEMLGQRRPSNVETVSAFIMKCAIAAQSKSKSLMPSVLLQMVNLRKRMVPPMPENTVGNPVWACEVILKERDMELPEIVAKMRRELTEFVNKKANKFKGDDGYKVINKSLRGRELLMERGVNTYWCTSFCRMPFYEIDFGWGKPVWAVAGIPVKNLIHLMDTKYGDGIEAWVTLDEQEMAIFERNEQLHEFSSLNSSPSDIYSVM